MNQHALRLGKQPTTRDPRTFRLANYLVDVTALEQQMPRTWNGYSAVTATRETWPMYGNDTLGDCVVAASAHMVELWRANAAREKIDIDDTEIVNAYWQASGGPGPAPANYYAYARNDPEWDNGLDPLAYLKQWQRDGIGGHKAGAYATVDPTNPTELRLASWLFGGLFVGLELPAGISGDPFAPWTMRTRSISGQWAPGTWGGHMTSVAYTNPDGGYLVTWGQQVRFSWTFFRVYADVIFAVLADDWMRSDAKAPNGFDLAALRDDLSALG